jgi:universal stress protein F
MGGFHRSAKIAIRRLTVHNSLTMPAQACLPALTSIKAKDVPAGNMSLSHEKETAMYKKIIVPVDLSATDKGEKILAKAKALLDADGEIVLINVVEELPGYMAIDLPVDLIENAIKDAKAKLADLKTRVGFNGSQEIRSGAPAREIIAAAEEHKADLIIIASHTPDFTNYFIGATADRVVRHAKCSVLIDR